VLERSGQGREGREGGEGEGEREKEKKENGLARFSLTIEIEDKRQTIRKSLERHVDMMAARELEGTCGGGNARGKSTSDLQGS
jgi:hypothetical protein